MSIIQKSESTFEASLGDTRASAMRGMLAFLFSGVQLSNQAVDGCPALPENSPNASLVNAYPTPAAPLKFIDKSTFL